MSRVNAVRRATEKVYTCLRCETTFDLDIRDIEPSDTCLDLDCRTCGTEWPVMVKCECGGDAVQESEYAVVVEERRQLKAEERADEREMRL